MIGMLVIRGGGHRWGLGPVVVSSQQCRLKIVMGRGDKASSGLVHMMVRPRECPQGGPAEFCDEMHRWPIAYLRRSRHHPLP
jgi:hypothetical protein